MLLFEKDFPEMAASRYEQNDDFFVRMFREPEMMKQVMDTLGAVLYERLKKSFRYENPEESLGMVAEDTTSFGDDL